MKATYGLTLLLLLTSGCCTYHGKMVPCKNKPMLNDFTEACDKDNCGKQPG